jgi:hypothetical protein
VPCVQVSTLTQLQELTLESADYDSGYAPLAALRSLRALRMECMWCVPANLSQLTWLESFTRGPSPPPNETDVEPEWLGRTKGIPPSCWRPCRSSPA